MKKDTLFLILAAALSAIAFATPAAADLGDDLARIVCPPRTPPVTYVLTSEQAAQWTSSDIHGTHVETATQTRHYTYSKEAGNSGGGACTYRVQDSAMLKKCYTAPVRKNSGRLTVGQYQSVVCQ